MAQQSRRRETAIMTAFDMGAGTAGVKTRTGDDLFAEFLAPFCGRYQPCLVAIAERRLTGQPFPDPHDPALADWVKRQNGRESRGNIYFHVNPCRPPQRGKARKSDLLALTAFHVDVDGKDQPDAPDWKDEAAVTKWRGQKKAMLPLAQFSGLPDPSVVVWSGGGFQLFWLLPEPLVLPLGGPDRDALIARYERVNKALGAAVTRLWLKADHTHNAERIMRLPGTTNWPDAKKRKAGRVPAPAFVHEPDQGVRHTLEDLEADLKKLEDFALQIEDAAVPSPREEAPAAAVHEDRADTGGAAPAEAEAMALFASFPAWLQRKVRSSPAKGDRNEEVFAAVQALFKCGLSAAHAESVLRLYPQGVAEKFIARGDLSAEIARQWAKFSERGADAGPAGSWAKLPEPGAAMPERAWPVLEPEALYGLLGEIAREAAERSEADPAMIYGTAATRFGIAAGRGAYHYIGEKAHHARLYIAGVGKTSQGRKGTSEVVTSRIFEKAEAQLASGMYGPIGRDGTRALAIERGPLSSGEGIIHAIRDPKWEAPKKKGKKNDAPAGLELVDPGVEDKRLLVIEEEFATALRANERTGNILSAVLRMGWDGATMSPLIKTNRDKASNPHVGVIGHITEPELHSLIGSVALSNGFANRFLWLCTRRSKLMPEPGRIPDDTVDALADRLADAIAWAHEHQREIAFTDDASAMWADAYPWLTREDRPGASDDVCGRLAPYARRIALLNAISDKSPAIEPRHLSAALAFVRYAEASAIYLFGGTSRDASSAARQKIMDALAAGPLTQDGVRDLFDRHMRAADLAALLDDMQASGLITCTEERTKGRPRKLWSREIS